MRLIGDLSLLRPSTKEIAYKLMWETRNESNAILNIACPYTSTEELSTVFKTIKDAKNTSQITKSDITVDLVDRLLYTDVPLDIMIRTSGESRLSDFMVWQVSIFNQTSRCTNIHFVQALWPEFSFWDMVPILFKFQSNFDKQQAARLTRNKSNERIEKLVSSVKCNRIEVCKPATTN